MLKCFNVRFMWQMWHVMLMLRYGVGAGVNRVFKLLPGDNHRSHIKVAPLLSARCV